MRSGITAVMIAIGVLFLSAGLMLFIAPLFWNSGIGYEGTYMLRDCVREVIGKGIAIDDDSSIALALILIFQGIRLMERRNRSIGSLLYSLWLLIPALLAISTLDSAPGSLPRLLSSILPGDPPAPLFLSMILTILFRMLLSMTRSVSHGYAAEDERRKALPAPRTKAETRPEPLELEVVDEIPVMAEAVTEAVNPENTEENAEEAASSSIDTSEALALMEKLLKDADTAATYQTLVRKRKKLLSLPVESLSKATNSIRGFRVYREEDGSLGNIEDEMAGMIIYEFSPFTIIAMNKKDAIRRIDVRDLSIPAFSMEQAMELAKADVEGYSKGGYAYSALEGELTIAGKRLNVERRDFLVPWYRKELSYDDLMTADKLFAWDFRLKYGLERGLTPYLTPGLGKDES